MTRAFGGVENGEAKHMLAPTATAISMGYGLVPNDAADDIAIGAMSTAVAVLLINILRTDVAK